MKAGAHLVSLHPLGTRCSAGSLFVAIEYESERKHMKASVKQIFWGRDKGLECKHQQKRLPGRTQSFEVEGAIDVHHSVAPSDCLE